MRRRQRAISHRSPPRSTARAVARPLSAVDAMVMALVDAWRALSRYLPG